MHFYKITLTSGLLCLAALLTATEGAPSGRGDGHHRRHRNRSRDSNRDSRDGSSSGTSGPVGGRVARQDGREGSGGRPRAAAPSPSPSPSPPAPQPEATTACAGCARTQPRTTFTEADLIQMRKEIVKRKLQTALNMPGGRPGNVTVPGREEVPAPLRHVVPVPRRPRQREQDPTRVMEINVFGARADIEVPRHRMSKSTFLRFTFGNEDLSTNRVWSAQLWLHITVNVANARDTWRINTYDVTANGVRRGNATADRHVRTGNHSGWVSLNLTDSTIRRFFSHIERHNNRTPDGHIELTLECFDCSPEGSRIHVREAHEFRPFLQLHTSRRLRRRHRRFVSGDGLDCSQIRPTQPSRCCRMKLYISFAELDFGIIAEPDGAWFNYCTGPCGDRMMAQYPQREVRLNHYNPSGYQPCCSPARLSAISILYFTQTGEYEHRQIENMVVDACGCEG